MKNLRNKLFLRIVLSFIMLAGCALPGAVDMQSKSTICGRKGASGRASLPNRFEG